MVLRHGQLRMYSNREVVRSGKDGRGLFVVINGLVRIGYQDPLGNTQEYFLGTGAASSFQHCPPHRVLGSPPLPASTISRQPGQSGLAAETPDCMRCSPVFLSHRACLQAA